MKIESVLVGDRVVKGALRVVASQPVVLESYTAPEVSGTKNLLAGITAGGTANYAWNGFQASNTLGTDDLAKLLVKNGLSQEHAPGAARKLLEIIHAEPTKVLLIAVSAGGTAWAAIEASSKLFGFSISTLRKFIISASVAAIAAIGYHYLRAGGYLQ